MIQIVDDPNVRYRMKHNNKYLEVVEIEEKAKLVKIEYVKSGAPAYYSFEDFERLVTEVRKPEPGSPVVYIRKSTGRHCLLIRSDVYAGEPMVQVQYIPSNMKSWFMTKDFQKVFERYWID